MLKKNINMRIMLALLALPLLMSCSKFSSTPGVTEATISFPSDPGTPIAKVGNHVITDESLKIMLGRNPFLASRVSNSDEAKREFIETQVREEIILQEAIKRGYLNQPETQRKIRSFLVGRLIKEEMEPLAAKAKPTEEQMQTYYNEHPDEFHKVAQLRAGYVFIPFGNDQKLAKKTANEAYKKLAALRKTEKNAIRAFEKLIPQYPTTTAMTGTDEKKRSSFYRTKEQTVQEFGQKASDALWAMGPDDELSQLVEGDNGYYIFYLFALKPALDQTFEQAKEILQSQVSIQNHKKAFAEHYDAIGKNHGVVIYEENLAKFSVSKHEDPNAQPAPQPAKAPTP